MAKLSSRDKDAKRKAELESTGSALCAEAEERVAKRSRKKSLDSVEKDVSTMERELIELEKKKQAEDHAFRMESLAIQREQLKIRAEDQRLLALQIAENAKRNNQMESLLVNFGNAINHLIEKK
ncbi:unnamed protein product [Aphanomyces euteiches]